ncbi:unnamed protein product, partial [Adineta steineri]
MLKKYTRKDLADAITSKLDSNAASIQFNVPPSTIRQHRREPLLNIRVGRSSYLTPEQETYLVALLKLLPDYGFEVTKGLALQLAGDYFKSLDLKTEPGAKWLHLFVKRHAGDITWKRQEKLERIRAESFTEETRSGWFATLHSVLEKHDLFDKPYQIFNFDETGFADKTKGQWVIVNSSSRYVFESNGGGGKNYRTALICISAGGQVLPPSILYSGKHLMDSWCKGGPPGTQYGVTGKGWIDIPMYEFWLENSFIPSTSHLNRPLLLIIDGHASHMSLKIIDLLRSNQIICLMLPSHSTHALQPLDVVVFNSVKKDWSEIVRNHMKDGNKSITNSQFPTLLKKLFIDKMSFSRTRIVSSFARAGIWPYDADAMRNKVAHNTSILTTTTSTNTLSIPTNILQPNLLVLPTLSYSSASSSLSSTTLDDTSDNISSNTDPSQSSFLINIFDHVIPLQPTTIVDNMRPLNTSHSPSYTTLQTCPLDLTFSLKSKNKRLSTSTGQSYNSRRDQENNNISCPSSSTPVVAVRRVMNTLLSQRTKELEKLNSQKKPLRSKRLPNHTGLNITDDEFILMKMQEAQEKKNQKIKTKTRGRPRKNLNNSPVQHHCNDVEIKNAISSLQSAINITN